MNTRALSAIGMKKWRIMRAFSRSTRTDFQNSRFMIVILAWMLATWTGCSSGPLPRLFASKERTSIITPSMRASTVREMSARAATAQQHEQQQMIETLAAQIRTEPDPLVRRAIQEGVGEIDVPLVQDILLAGLNDTDSGVRMVCCRKLGQRAAESSIGALQQVVRQDDDFDVRLAAVSALGNIRSSRSVQALAIALADRNPAMKNAAVEAMKTASGQDYGNDFQAWQKYAESENPQVQPAATMAQRLQGYMPF
jgi:HEAT repeats